jgi:hypothetical protein
MLTLSLFSGAWKNNFKIENKFAGSGTEKTPAEEKDYAYLFCENDSDADAAKKGKIDWRRSNAHDYCWQEHKGSDDSWKSAWERSRLMRGCKWQLQGFGNKIFRCYDIKSDPEFAAIEQAYSEQKKSDYENWLTVYNAKVEELNKGITDAFGDVDTQIKVAQDDVEKALRAQEKARQEAALTNYLIGQMTERHSQMDTLLTSLVTIFDKGWNEVLAKSEKISLTITDITGRLESYRTALKSSDRSFAVLSQIQTNALPVLDDAFNKVCQESDVAKDIETLRTQVAYLNRLIAMVVEDAERMELPVSFAQSKQRIVDKAKSLYEISERREFVFDSTYDILSEKPAVCGEIAGFKTELGKAVSLAKRVEELKRTVGVIQNMEAAIKQVEIEKEAEAQYHAALTAARDIEAQFISYVQTGRISAARTLIGNLDSDMSRVLSAPSLLQSSADRTRLSKEIEGIKATILDTASYRLSLDAAHSLISEKLRQIKIKIMKLELKSKKVPSLNAAWALQKKDVLTILNTKPGQDIVRPAFADWSSLTEYEKMLNSMAASMDQLLIYNP